MRLYRREHNKVDYHHVKFSSHKHSDSGNTVEKAELAASIGDIARFLKSGTPIYNSEVSDTAGRKIRVRRRIQAITKRFAFHANPIRANQGHFEVGSTKRNLK